VYDVAKTHNFVMNVLPFYDDVHFVKYLRMSHNSFDALVNVIKSDKVFQSRGNKPQASVDHQLMVFLRRIGSTTDIFSICSQHGISEGTVVLYVKRVMKALRKRASDFVKWPQGDQRHAVHAGFKEIGGFTNVIGAIDGTHIILATAPWRDSEVYFNRKRDYSIQCQGIVNHKGLFIDYTIGFPGSVHDARVYRNSKFFANKSNLFQGEDFVLANSAYPLSTFCITPFRPAQGHQKQFNQLYSAHRIVVEHAFGRLKNRFCALKRLSVKDVETAVKLTECAIILHNFLEIKGKSGKKQKFLMLVK